MNRLIVKSSSISWWMSFFDWMKGIMILWLNPLASNLTMDQIALSEEMDIVFQIQLTDGEPILHPKKIDV